MSGTITLTAAMRANLLSLQQTGNQLSTTQLDLSTGNKVNSALDNPVNFFAAQSLNSRASQLSSLLDGMGQAVQTIQAANQGITSITTLVNQLTSIVNSANQDIANTTTKNVLAATLAASGIDSNLVANLTDATAAKIAAGDSFSLQDGTAPAVTFTIGSGAGETGESLQDVADAINNTAGFSAQIVTGNGTNKLPGAAGATMTAGLAYLEVSSTDGKAITATNITNSPITTLFGAGTTGSNPEVTGGSAADQVNYAAVLTQINAVASDSNYQGNNLINGTGNNLTVNVNELSTHQITVSSVDSTTTGLALAATDVNSGDTAAAQAAINAALSTLKGQASGFANSLSLIQTRQDFTTNLINTLQNGATSLTIADKNEEGANLLALQTQQQLGIEALSLSSQANQSVLRLFA